MMWPSKYDLRQIPPCEARAMAPGAQSRGGGSPLTKRANLWRAVPRGATCGAATLQTLGTSARCSGADTTFAKPCWARTLEVAFRFQAALSQNISQ